MSARVPRGLCYLSCIIAISVLATIYTNCSTHSHLGFGFSRPITPRPNHRHPHIDRELAAVAPAEQTTEEPSVLVDTSVFWLVIGITTVTRPYHAHYLQDTINAYDAALHHYYNDNNKSKSLNESKHNKKRVKIVVFNSDDNHSNHVFYDMRDTAKLQQRIHFDFVHNKHRRLSANESLVVSRGGFKNFNLPVALRKEQQSLDVAAMIEYVLDTYSGNRQLSYFMFGEDDSLLRVDGIYRIIELLNDIETQYNESFACARLSYGFNGVVLQAQDLGCLHQKLVSLAYKIPCDYIIGDYARTHNRSTREVNKYDRNDPQKLYRHIGVHSAVQWIEFAKNQSGV